MKQSCYYLKFYLFVTGKGEEKHLHKLFSALSEIAPSAFIVAARVDQLGAIKSSKRLRRETVVGTNKSIPDRLFNKVVAPIRRYVTEDPCNFVILMDDLEYERIKDGEKIFERYRELLDKGLGSETSRGSVHFLANMVEAYFFADFQATNTALALASPLSEHVGDVERIRNPKHEIRKRLPTYNEIEDAGKVLNRIDLRRVLAEKDSCAWLRSCVKWTVEVLEQYTHSGVIDSTGIRLTCHLDDGKVSGLTAAQ